MIQLVQQYDGGKEKIYATKSTFKEAKELLNFIKSNCIVIGEGRLGFYAKTTNCRSSIPFTILIRRG